jgi:hypothetical protein
VSARAEAASNTGPSGADSAAARTDGGSGRATRVRWGNAPAPPAAKETSEDRPMRCAARTQVRAPSGIREPTLGGIGPKYVSAAGATPPAARADGPRVWAVPTPPLESACHSTSHSHRHPWSTLWSMAPGAGSRTRARCSRLVRHGYADCWFPGRPVVTFPASTCTRWQTLAAPADPPLRRLWPAGPGGGDGAAVWLVRAAAGARHGFSHHGLPARRADAPPAPSVLKPSASCTPCGSTGPATLSHHSLKALACWCRRPLLVLNDGIARQPWPGAGATTYHVPAERHRQGVGGSDSTAAPRGEVGPREPSRLSRGSSSAPIASSK